jgi:hypothetical protein
MTVVFLILLFHIYGFFILIPKLTLKIEILNLKLAINETSPHRANFCDYSAKHKLAVARAIAMGRLFSYLSKPLEFSDTISANTI